MHFRIPCPISANDIDFDEKRSSWVGWMVTMGFNEPTTAHPNICYCDITTVCSSISLKSNLFINVMSIYSDVNTIDGRCRKGAEEIEH